MSRKNKNYNFWTGYSDLMTSLFFVMLMLFILTITLLHKRIVASEEERVATQKQLDKITEIEEAVKGIDSTYFDYNTIYKKHVLKIRVNFPVGVSNMNVVDSITKNELKDAGYSIVDSLNKITKEYPGIQYLLVIEGQASSDNYSRNYELSYERALSLSRFWTDNEIDFGRNCEVLISGSGVGGIMRDKQEYLNQRFLIHLIPKPGIIEQVKKEK